MLTGLTGVAVAIVDAASPAGPEPPRFTRTPLPVEAMMCDDVEKTTAPLKTATPVGCSPSSALADPRPTTVETHLFGSAGVPAPHAAAARGARHASFSSSSRSRRRRAGMAAALSRPRREHGKPLRQKR